MESEPLTGFPNQTMTLYERYFSRYPRVGKALAALLLLTIFFIILSGAVIAFNKAAEGYGRSPAGDVKDIDVPIGAATPSPGEIPKINPDQAGAPEKEVVPKQLPRAAATPFPTPNKTAAPKPQIVPAVEIKIEGNCNDAVVGENASTSGNKSCVGT